MFLDESRRMNNPGEWEEEEIVNSPMIYGVVNVNGVNGYGTASLAEVDQNLQDGIHSRLGGGTVDIHSTGLVSVPSCYECKTFRNERRTRSPNQDLIMRRAHIMNRMGRRGETWGLYRPPLRHPPLVPGALLHLKNPMLQQ